MLVLTNLRAINSHKLIIKSSIIFSFYLFIIIQDGKNNILFFFPSNISHVHNFIPFKGTF
jgi:hypothetical protein